MAVVVACGDASFREQGSIARPDKKRQAGSCEDGWNRDRSWRSR